MPPVDLREFFPSPSVGVAWRPGLESYKSLRADLQFVEIIVEHFIDKTRLDGPLAEFLERGLPMIPHGISLSLAGADPIDKRRIDNLARVAEMVNAPLVSEHLAFVRAGPHDAGHLLPPPRTRAMIEIFAENVAEVRRVVGVPLAIENITELFTWPDDEMDSATFLSLATDAAGCLILLDLENVNANAKNHNVDPNGVLESLPLDRVAYIHVAGGEFGDDGSYHDTHSTPVDDAVLAFLTEVTRRVGDKPVLLERDANFPDEATLRQEIEAIRAVLPRSAQELAKEPV